MHGFFISRAQPGLVQGSAFGYHGGTMSTRRNTSRPGDSATEFFDRLEADMRRAREVLVKRPHSAEEYALRQRICKAFRGVTCPKERALVECYSWDDYHTDPQLLKRIRSQEERRNWAALPPELLLACDDGRYHTGPEAFRFILPAYMLLPLDYDSSWLTDVFFCVYGTPKKKRSASTEWLQEKYSLLTDEQRATVEQWVDYLRQRELWDEKATLPWLVED